jgi:hypothetical protein
MPHHAQIKVEHIPTDAFAAFYHDSGSVSHKRPPVDTKRFETRAGTVGNGMRLCASVIPCDRPACPDSHVIQFKPGWRV